MAWSVWLLGFCVASSLCEARESCDIRLLYSRLLGDVVLADTFCTEFLDGASLSTNSPHRFGAECPQHRAELTTACSIFRAAKNMFRVTGHAATDSVTVTITETALCGAPTSWFSATTASSAPPASLLSAPVVDPLVYQPWSSLTPAAVTSSSVMTTAIPSTLVSSTLSTTSNFPCQSSLSSLAPSAPAKAKRCRPTPLPPAVDRHVFTPLVDLTMATSAGVGVTIDDSSDTHSENCSPFTMIDVVEQASTACVHLTGSWTPLYNNVYYECIARTKAPEYDPSVHSPGVTGLNFTSTDNSQAVVNSRSIGPRPEHRYEEASLTLFVPKAKTYLVDVWACGPGPSWVIGEFSCTYFD